MKNNNIEWTQDTQKKNGKKIYGMVEKKREKMWCDTDADRKKE